MTGPDIAFLGPSLRQSEARALYPDLVVLPPAAMGDVLGAVNRHRPHAVALIDGTFLTNMSVYHKELLYAMEQGVWVLGGSSMGALRAAECDQYGMIGVGGIYERFASGELEDDDEVALTHADRTLEYQPVSDAMVTIRAGIAGAEAAGLLTPDEASELIARQKARWFPDRRLSLVSRDAEEIGVDPDRCRAIHEFMRNDVVDPKREDALAVLARMAELPAEPAPVEERVTTVMSGVFAALLARDVAVEAHDGLEVSFDEMRRYAVLHDSEYETFLRRARQSQVLAGLSFQLGGPPSPEEELAARQQVAARVGVPVEEVDAWARSQDLDERGLRFLIRVEALTLRVERSWLGRARIGLITQPMLNEYRLAGRYDELKSAAALQHSAAATVHFDQSPSPMTVLRTLAALGWNFPPNIVEYLDEHDLGELGELMDTAETSVRAHYALFGLPLVESEGEEASIFDASEPMMTRGS